MHYRRARNDGHPGEAAKRTPGPGIHGYPGDDELVALMARHGDFNGVAADLGVARESLRDYLATRPTLRDRMYAAQRPRLTVQQALENDRRCSREWARRWRAENPDEARRQRRQQMAAYGPEYRQRWNHYNRLRRLQIAPPDDLADEYALVLRGDPCCYCGAPMEHVDHIDPIARRGTGAWDNLTAACADCNLRKSARPLLEFLLVRLAA
jgi:5-methylcytosine-specific restriction endonuclease McrA